MPKGKYKRKDVPRGAYNQSSNPILNPKYTRTIMLLATERNTNDEIKQEGINPSTWTNTYRSNLDNLKLYRKETLTNKRVVYHFNWENFLIEIKKEILNCLDQTMKDLDNIVEYIETNKTNKKNKQKIQYSKRKAKKNVKSSLQLSETTKNDVKNHINRKNYRTGLLLIKECKTQILNIKKFKKKISGLFENTKKDNLNWLICQLYVFYYESLWVNPSKKEFLKRKKKKEKDESSHKEDVFKSIYEETMDFFSAMASTNYKFSRRPSLVRKYPFDVKKVNKKKFQEYIAQFNTNMQFNLNWLIVLKPNYTKKILSQ